MACMGQLHLFKGWQCYVDQQAFVFRLKGYSWIPEQNKSVLWWCLSWIQQYIIWHGNLLTVTRVKTATWLQMYASLSPVPGYKVLHCFLQMALYICHYSLETNYLRTQLLTLSQSHIQYPLFCLTRYVVNFHFFLPNFTEVSCNTNNKNTSWQNGGP